MPKTTQNAKLKHIRFNLDGKCRNRVNSGGLHTNFINRVNNNHRMDTVEDDLDEESQDEAPLQPSARN